MSSERTRALASAGAAAVVLAACGPHIPGGVPDHHRVARLTVDAGKRGLDEIRLGLGRLDVR